MSDSAETPTVPAAVPATEEEVVGKIIVRCHVKHYIVFLIVDFPVLYCKILRENVPELVVPCFTVIFDMLADASLAKKNFVICNIRPKDDAV